MNVLCIIKPWEGGPRVLGRAGLVFIFRLDTAFIFRLDTAINVRLDTAIIFRLATAILFRLATAIIFRLDTAIIFRLATAFIVYTQKNLLCIHKRSLVHAQHSCAYSGPGTPGAGPFWFGLGGPGPGPDPFGLAWGARVLGRTGLYD